MSRLKSRKDVPDVQVPKRSATVWEIESNAVLMELEARKEQHHQNWGIDRLITLVDTEFRVKFWGQMSRVWDSLEFGDIDRLKKAVNGMVKGYEALEKWAADNEVSQNPQTKFVEWKTQDGNVFAVVPTINDSLDLQRQRKDIGTIWTLEEFEVIMSDPLVQQVIKIKAFDPTATVTKFKANENFGKGSGFDDMEDDLEPGYGGTEPAKMFNLPHKK
jgi:hypothetical protein